MPTRRPPPGPLRIPVDPPLFGNPAPGRLRSSWLFGAGLGGMLLELPAPGPWSATPVPPGLVAQRALPARRFSAWLSPPPLPSLATYELLSPPRRSAEHDSASAFFPLMFAAVALPGLEGIARFRRAVA